MSKSGQLRQAHMTSTAGIPMLPPSDAVVVLHPSPDVDISPMLREELARLRGLRRTYNAAKECVAKSGAEIARLEEAIADAEAQLASSRQALTNFLAEVGGARGVLDDSHYKQIDAYIKEFVRLITA